MARGGNYGSVPSAVGAAATWRLDALPRRVVLGAVGTFALLVTSVLNKSRVINKKSLLELVYNRPPGKPLLTCSNHMSTLDDPLMWGVKGVAFCPPEKMRWTQAADNICFTNPLYSYFFRLGKCIPICRGTGILQPGMQETLQKLDVGDWVHVFPEGKVKQNDDLVLPRLKWGIGRLISETNIPPIVLPIAHSGFEKVMPERSTLGGRGYLPRIGHNITIVIGEPIEFDLFHLKKLAMSQATGMSLHQDQQKLVNSDVPGPKEDQMDWQKEYRNSSGNSSWSQGRPAVPAGTTPTPTLAGHAIIDPLHQWLYSHITSQVHSALQKLVYEAHEWNTRGSQR